MKFSRLPEGSLFRIGGEIAPGVPVYKGPQPVYRKVPVLHTTDVRDGVVQIIGVVNTVRLGDGQISGCGPDVEVHPVHRVEHCEGAAA